MHRLESNVSKDILHEWNIIYRLIVTLLNNTACKNNTIETSKCPQPDTIFFQLQLRKQKHIWIKLPNGGYLQVRYFINLEMYITEFSRHYFNRMMFLLRTQSVVTVKIWDWSETSRQPVTDQSPTSLRPPKTFLRSILSQRGFTFSKQNLLVIKSSTYTLKNIVVPISYI